MVVLSGLKLVGMDRFLSDLSIYVGVTVWGRLKLEKFQEQSKLGFWSRLDLRRLVRILGVWGFGLV